MVRNQDKSFIDNIEEIFTLTLPRKTSISSTITTNSQPICFTHSQSMSASISNIQVECGICYAKINQSKPINLSTPNLDHDMDGASEITVCCNSKCSVTYHSECLGEWIRSAESNLNLFTIRLRGKCVYCQEWIYV
jgi:FANCL C-terminal domain